MPDWLRHLPRAPHRSNTQSSADTTTSLRETWKSFKRSLSRSRSRSKDGHTKIDRAKPAAEPQLHDSRGNVHPSLRRTTDLSDLSRSEKETFARVLRTDGTVYPSVAEYHTRTAAMIKHLDRHLQEPAKADSLMLARRLAARYRMGKDIGATPKIPVLCEMHNRLNEQLILSIRICVEAFAKDHLRTLLAGISSDDFSRLASPTQRCALALQDSLAIILRPRDWCTLFEREYPQRFRDRANRCDACYLGAMSDSMRTMTGLRCIIDVSESAALCSSDACAVAREWVDACLTTWTKDHVDRMQSTGETVTSDLCRALSLGKLPQLAATKASTPVFLTARPEQTASVLDAASTSQTINSSSALPSLDSTAPKFSPYHTKPSLDFPFRPSSQSTGMPATPSFRQPLRPRQRNERMPIEVVEDALRAYRDYGRTRGQPAAKETPEAFVKDVIPDPLRMRTGPMSPAEKAERLKSRIVRPARGSILAQDGSQKTFRRHAAVLGNEWPKINVYDGGSYEPSVTPRKDDSPESLSPPWYSSQDPRTKLQRVEDELMAALSEQDPDAPNSTPGLTMASTFSVSPRIDRKE